MNEAREQEGLMIKSVESVKGSERSAGTIFIEGVADVLDREQQHLIDDWLIRVEREPDLMSIPLNFRERTGHLPHLLHDVIRRLRPEAGAMTPTSEASVIHGDLRHRQGYTPAMLVEESRLLEDAIFTILHKNVKYLEFSTLLPNLVAIADEVDAQLKHQMLGFMAVDVADKAKGKSNGLGD